MMRVMTFYDTPFWFPCYSRIVLYIVAFYRASFCSFFVFLLTTTSMHSEVFEHGFFFLQTGFLAVHNVRIFHHNDFPCPHGFLFVFSFSQGAFCLGFHYYYYYHYIGPAMQCRA